MTARSILRTGAAACCLTLVTLLSGCDDDPTPPEAPVPKLLMAASPPTQVVDAGTVAAGPFVIVAEKEGFARVSGAIVNFTVTGGTLSASADTTDGTGMARVTWTLSVTPGVSTVTATSSSVPDTSVVFTAEGRAPTAGGELR